jgi:membrane protein
MKKNRSGAVKKMLETFTRLRKTLQPHGGPAKGAPGRKNTAGFPRTQALLRIIVAAYKKFIADDCMTKASSIAYTSIVSLVPTLTVILTVYSVFSGMGNQKDEFFTRISLFLLEHNIKINIDPIFAAISGLIDNAGKIGIIGSVVMIFSATAMLRSLEKSLNDIWKIKTQRPLLLKVVYYWAALTLGPLLIFAGATAATKVQQAFSSPNYEALSISGRDLWVAGNKNALLKGEIGSHRLNELSLETIDFDNQKNYRYDAATQSFRLREERVSVLEFSKHRFKDMQFSGSRAWIAGDRGMLLFSENRGETWQIRKLGEFNLNDICMIDGDRGFIASDSGVILNTADGGKSWNVQSIEGSTANFIALCFRGALGMAAGNRGTALISENTGASWKLMQISAARRGNLLADLKAVFFSPDRRVWIAGDNGLIMASGDNGKTWEPRPFMQTSYSAGLFTSPERGFIAGNKGVILSTTDGGETWKKKQIAADRINRLAAVDGAIIAAGNNGLFMASADGGATWKGTAGTPFLALVLNFFAPFLFIWIFFLFIYIVIPNTRVPFKYGAIGATFTGAIWVIFILFFDVYVRAFATGTFAVYGALVSIPLFLLLVYTSVVITLLGAVVSYVSMHRASYELSGAIEGADREIEIYNGIAFLVSVYGTFEQGRGVAATGDVMKATGMTPDQGMRLLELFEKENLIHQREDGALMPATASKNIRIMDIMDLLHAAAYRVPHAGKKAALKNYMTGVFAQLRAGQKTIISDTTLDQLIALQ